jgi:L-aspartate oxidase
MDSIQDKLARSFDLMIVGSGLAGLSTALLAPVDQRVAVLTKRELSDGASR